MAGNTTPPLPVILVSANDTHRELGRLPPCDTLDAAREAAVRAGYALCDAAEVPAMSAWGGHAAHVVAVRA